MKATLDKINKRIEGLEFSEPERKSFVNKHVFQTILSETCEQLSLSEKMSLIDLHYHCEWMLNATRYQRKGLGTYYHHKLRKMFHDLSSEQQARGGIAYFPAQAYYEYVYKDLDTAAKYLSESIELIDQFSYASDIIWAAIEQRTNLFKVFVKQKNWNRAQEASRIIIGKIYHMLSTDYHELKDEQAQAKLLGLSSYFLDSLMEKYAWTSESFSDFTSKIRKLFADVEPGKTEVSGKIPTLVSIHLLHLYATKKNDEYIEAIYENIEILGQFPKYLQYTLLTMLYENMVSTYGAEIAHKMLKTQMETYFGDHIETPISFA